MRRAISPRFSADVMRGGEVGMTGMGVKKSIPETHSGMDFLSG
jgi:hypothetical protein